MPDVLIHAGTLHCAEMRHEVPTPILDPFLYGERDGRPFAAVSVIDDAAIRAARPGIEIHELTDLGLKELLDGGASYDDAMAEVAVRACERAGVRVAAVPATFPLLVADRLRAAGVELTADGDLFSERRRAKAGAELDGVRRAAAAASAGMATAASVLRDPGDEPLTSERLRGAIRAAFEEHGAQGDEFIVAHGAQAAAGHDLGSGPIAPGETVVVDLWPQDRESGCWADMTRTFVVGDPPEDVVRWHGLCRDALARVLDVLRPGVTGRELWEVACDVFEAAGEPTQREPRGAEPLRDGFFHSLGHGVGLEVHESPNLGRSGGADTLVAGDVVAVEPGLYRAGYGGVRIEDLFLVTDDGWERLTSYSDELRP